MEKKGLKGTVVFYGCPGEELLTGKPLWQETALSVIWMAGAPSRQIQRCFRRRYDRFELRKIPLQGRTAHAGDPAVVSALDAVG